MALLNNPVNPVIALDSIGLEYQIINPLSVSMGPYQLKNDWPIPVIKTGNEPAKRSNEKFFLFLGSST